MKNIFNPGDKKKYTCRVDEDDLVKFRTGALHSVYSTYAITRDAEWVCRLFVLDIKDNDEEGIGSMVKVIHHAPAKVGTEIIFTGTFISLNKNEVLCSFEAHDGNRLIASGETAQKILKKEKIEQVLNKN
ncbi:hypothetical protein LBMAG27_03140 [Bacteroidota bacterium]|nr:hypothetical protein LBMAG27_03140 [Bacteroidota bacterium]